LLISPGLPPPFGGIQTATEGLAAALAPLIDIRVVALSSNGEARDFPARIVRDDHGWLSRGRFIIETVAAVTRRPPDIVHAMTWRAALPTALLPSRFRRPIVLHAHGSEVRRAGVLTRRLRNLVFRRAALVICVSAFTADIVRREVGADPLVVGNGVSLPASTPTRETDPSRLRVLSVGRLVRRKGFDALIRACDLARAGGVEVELTVVGEGPERATLTDAVASRPWVRLTGHLSDEHLEREYASADVFALLPQPLEADVEGFGIVFLEAAAHGLPVVATGVGGVPDVVRPQQTGMIVSSDAEAAEALTALAQHPEMRRRLGDAGRRMAEQSTWTVRAQQLQRLYESVGQARARVGC